MRLHRFYIYKPLGEEIVVENVGEGKEYNSKLLHQWTNVFRYTSGDEVILFSASTPGHDFVYKLLTISKQAATLVPVSSLPTILSKFPIALAMAVVKKDTFETIVRQATELGVTHIIPLLASRSEKKNLNFERLSSISIEAAEQSGRGDVPFISDISTFEQALKQTHSSIGILGSLQGSSTLSSDNISALQEKGIALWIGPEGGWTEEEEELGIKNGLIPLKLATTVLKADTAALALLSWILGTAESH